MVYAHHDSPLVLRALKYIHLLKAVTTGRLRHQVNLPPAEILGRIRLVADGHLQVMVAELSDDEKAHLQAEQSSLAAAALDRARAQAAGELPAEQTTRHNAPVTPTDEWIMANALRLCAGGYLNKAYALFKASPLADTSHPRVRDNLRALHPLPTEQPDIRDDLGVQPYVQDYQAFCEVFAAPPRERGLGPHALSYEELSAYFHSGDVPA
jgi:hypothetical protein